MALDHSRDRVAGVAGLAKPPNGSPTSDASVMGRDIVVTGNIDASVDLMIEGRVVGDVTCATLILGPDSSIAGSIRAERVRVSGRVEGAIETIELALEATADVKGDISYSRLKIASGAVVQGSLIHVPDVADEDNVESKLKLVEAPTPAQAIRYFE